MTPTEIEALFASEGSKSAPRPGAGADTDTQNDPSLDEDERTRRTDALKDVLGTTKELWQSGSSELDAVVEQVGVGSRDEIWRLPIGGSGILEYFLGLLASEDLRQTLKVHILRLVGNSCADTDENRARVVASGRLPDLVKLVADDSVLSFAIPVLYNIMVDYEPAQLDASKASLSARLIDLISGPRFAKSQHLIGIICKILALLSAQEPEPSLADPSTPEVLLTLAAKTTPDPPELEDFTSLSTAALTYLSHERLQHALLASPSGVPALLAASSSAHTVHVQALPYADPDDAAQLRQLRRGFVLALADVSGRDAFARLHGPSTPVFQTLSGWLRLPALGYAALHTGACLALGNLARSDEVCAELVLRHWVHEPVIALLLEEDGVTKEEEGEEEQGGGGALSSPSQPMDAQLQHAALSFLKNLAIPAPNKPVLGTAGLADLLPRLWGSTAHQPPMQFAAVSLTRLLLVGCPANVDSLLAPFRPSSPAGTTADTDPAPTRLHALLAVLAKADAEPTRTEAARAVLAVLRVLHDGSTTPSTKENGDDDDDDDDSAARRARFYTAHPAAADAPAYLLAQTRWPTLRGEALFVLALAARRADGAAFAARAVRAPEAVRALVAIVAGRPEGGDEAQGEGEDGEQDKLARALARLSAEDGGAAPAEAAGDQTGAAGGEAVGDTDRDAAAEGDQAALLSQLGSLEPQQADSKRTAGLAQVDRENGLVLLAELLKGAKNEVSEAQRAVFEELLRMGGQLVVEQRQQSVGRSG